MTPWSRAVMCASTGHTSAAAAVKAGHVEPSSTIALTLAGRGLKDPDRARESATRPVSVRARLDAVLAQRGF